MYNVGLVFEIEPYKSILELAKEEGGDEFRDSLENELTDLVVSSGFLLLELTTSLLDRGKSPREGMQELLRRLFDSVEPPIDPARRQIFDRARQAIESLGEVETLQ